MSDAYARDPVELLVGDGFAMSKRTGGFVPRTIFYDEPTGNAAVKNGVAFFQDFGVPDPRQTFQALDEGYSPEITLADVVQFGEAWLLEHGFHYPQEVEPRKTEWVPIWPPMLRLVEVEPEWRSVDFEEDIAKREERWENEEYNRLIRRACPLCAAGQDLALIYETVREYVHGTKHSNAMPCPATRLHRARQTITEYLPERDEEVA